MLVMHIGIGLLYSTVVLDFLVQNDFAKMAFVIHMSHTAYDIGVFVFIMVCMLFVAWLWISVCKYCIRHSSMQLILCAFSLQQL